MDKKSKPSSKKEEKSEAVKEKYFYAIGRRKSSIAQARLFESRKEGGEIIVNEKKLNEYFTIDRLRKTVTDPLTCTGQADNFKAKIKVKGGGINSQAEAVRLAISRALVVNDETLKKSLSDLGFMKRDSRKVERKKPGLKKARRAPQWAKR